MTPSSVLAGALSAYSWVVSLASQWTLDRSVLMEITENID